MTDWEIVREIVRTILVMSVTGGIIALLLFAVKPLIKNRIPKTAQYYLWVLVLIALLVPFSTFISVSVNTPITSAKQVIDDNVKTTQEWYEERAKTQYNLPFDDLEAEEQVDIIFQDSKWWMNSTLLTTPIVCGITTFLIAVFSYLVYIFKLRRRRLPAHENETSILRILVQGERMPNLFRNGLAPTPMLVGIIRPTIYLPDIKYSDVQLRNILLHELTHLRRHDIIVKWITAFAVHIHWFNPIVYFVRREIDRACELSCDEAVIKNLDDDEKQHYGDTLISVASDKRLPKTVLSTTMCEEKKALKERLGAIMKHKRFSVWTIAVSCVLVASVLCGTIILGASALSRNIEAEQENTQKDQAELENVPSPVKLTKPSEPLLSTAFLEAGKIERIGNLNISGLISKETAYLFQTTDSNVCEVIFPVSGYVYHIDVTFVRESENSEWTLSPVNAVNIFDPAR